MTSYPPGMRLRPIDTWPMAHTSPRRYSPFNSTFTSTLQLLEQELRRLDPKDAQYPPSVLQLALQERDFRKSDGMPRAGSSPSHPGVILTIEPRNKPVMTLPCDTFQHWHDNLRAIALTLEALRKIERYGVTRNGQQYRGWQAIEAKAEPNMTVAAAIQVLMEIGELPEPTTHDEMARALRSAKGRAHPDRHDGHRTLWDRLEVAEKVLRAAGLVS